MDLVCVKLYLPQQKISFPKSKEAYFSLDIITNKPWEPLAAKSTPSRSYFSYDIGVDNWNEL